MAFLQKRLNKKAIAALIVAAVMSCSVITGFSIKTEARDSYTLGQMVQIQYASEEELEQARRERDAALAQAQAATSRVSSLTSEREELSGELEALNELDEEQRGQYEILSSQYAAALIAKAEALERYIEAQDNLAETQRVFAERLSVMFEYQNKSVLEVLLESDSIAGFFTNIELIGLIGDADEQAIDQMQIALDDAELANVCAREAAEEAEAAALAKADELREIEEQIGITEASITDLDVQISSAQQTAGEYNALVNQLNSQISSIQDELYRQYNPPTPQAEPEDPENVPPQEETSSEETSSDSEQTEEATPTPSPVPTTAPASSSTGQLQWPTWCRQISDYYGWRIHPIYGTQKWHAGLDIADGYGDIIGAAAAGTVVYVEEPVPGQNTGGTGYGNYCIIDHGNGLYTLYGHCRDVYVTTGQTVAAGESIGEVGSTGGSTGPHLHFEVRLNSAWGATDDPLNYLP